MGYTPTPRQTTPDATRQAAAKTRGVYHGRRRSLTPTQVSELVTRAGAGEPKAALAKAYGISRETVYQYLRATSAGTPASATAAAP